MAAPTPVQRTLVDSKDHIVRTVTIPLAGDADVAATVLADISTFTTGVTPTSVIIERVTWSLDGFSVRIFEDATTDVHLVTLAAGTGDLRLPEPTTTTGASGSVGDICFTTVGVGTTDSGFFTVVFRKVA